MKQLIISVHGIRTFGGWQERLERLLVDSKSGTQPVVINYKYGYFSIIAFIIPFLRWLVVRRFRQFLVYTTQAEKWDRIDLVGHSFGTHIIAWALYGLGDTKRPPINTLILAGSVLKSNFPWQVLIGRSVRRVVNDCGVRDNVLLLNQLVVLLTGMAGRLGFNGGTGRTFRNRFFDYDHSGYFLTDGTPDDSFMQHYWVPLLLTDSDPELVDVRRPSSLGGIYMTLLNNAEPIKLVIYMAPFIAFSIWIGNLYLETKRQRDHTLTALRTQSRLIRDVSARELGRGDIVSASLLALEGLPDAKSNSFVRRDWPYVAELERHVFDNLMTVAESTLVRVRTASTSPFILSQVAGRMVVGGDLYDGSSGKRIATLSDVPEHQGNLISFAKGGSWIVYIHKAEAKIVQAADGRELAGLLANPKNVQQVFIDDGGTAAVTIHTDGAVWLQPFGQEAKLIRGAAVDNRAAFEVALWGRVVFDPLSRTFVFTPGDNTVELWNLGEKRKIRTITEPLRILHGAVFDPLGERFLTKPYQDGKKGNVVAAHLYNSRDGELLKVFSGHLETVWDVEFSRNGTRLLTASMDNTAKIWNVETGRAVATLTRHTTDVVQATFVGRKKDKILTVGASSTGHEQDDITIRLWNTDGTLIKDIGTPQYWVSSLTIKPDRTQIAVSTSDHRTQVWSLDDGSSLLTFGGHRSYIRGTRYSADESHVITLSDDRTLRFWKLDADNQWITRVVEPPVWDGMDNLAASKPASIVDATLEPTGERLAMLVGDKKLRIFSMVSGEPTLEHTLFFGEGVSLFVDLRQGIWANLEAQRLVLRDIFSNVELDAVSIRAGEPRLVTANKGAGIWLIAAHDGKISIRNFISRRETGALLTNPGTLTTMTIGGRGRRLMTISGDGLARWWDVASLRELAQASLSAGSKVFTDSTADRTLISSESGEHGIWDLDGQKLSSFSGDRINRAASSFRRQPVAAFSPHGDLLALAMGNVVELRIVRNGAVKRRLLGHKEQVAIWRDLGAVNYTRPADVTDLAFTSDGGRLLSASDDGTVRIWDLATGETVGTYSGHGAVIPAIQPAHVFSSSTPEVFFFRSIKSVALIKNDQRAVTASADGTARIWPLLPSTQALVDKIKSVMRRCLTPTQRTYYRLEPEPPEWCIDERKWPYDTEAWRDWLGARRADKVVKPPTMDVEDTLIQ